MIRRIEIDNIDREKLCNRIKYVTRQVCNLKDKITSGSKIDDKDICNIKSNIISVLESWTQNGKVGFRKPKEEVNVYQEFFISFFDLIIVRNECKDRNYRNWLCCALYRGKICRYIQLERKLEYDNIWTSWSKTWSCNEYYMRTHLDPDKTYVILGDTKREFGIDLENLGVSVGGEREVVFPMSKDCVIGIKKI